jgi:hypothetical protein
MLDGADSSAARAAAEQEIKGYLNGTKNFEDLDYSDVSIGSDFERVYYGGYTSDNSFIGGKKCYADSVSYAKKLAKEKGILVDKGKDYFKTGKKPITAWKHWHIVDSQGKELSSGKFASEGEASSEIYTKTNALKAKLARGEQLTAEELRWGKATVKFYQTGGLVDYTGIAMVHGSKTKPEAFLNADQTAQIKEAL